MTREQCSASIDSRPRTRVVTGLRAVVPVQVAGRSVWVVDLSQYEWALLELVDVTPPGFVTSHTRMSVDVETGCRR